MATEKTELSTNGPRCYEAELVVRYYVGGVNPPSVLVLYMTFAHVLNVPASEEVWPEDAIELFFPDVFAARFVGDTQGYRCYGVIWDHIREELLRLSDTPGSRTLESIWLSQHQLYCYDFNGSFAKELFGNDSSQNYPNYTNWDEAPFSDGCEDEYGGPDWLDSQGSIFFDDEEPDTLNSELLLTEECLAPDSVEQSAVNKPLNPKCRVGVNQPIEQED